MSSPPAGCAHPGPGRGGWSHLVLSSCLPPAAAWCSGCRYSSASFGDHVTAGLWPLHFSWGLIPREQLCPLVRKVILMPLELIMTFQTYKENEYEQGGGFLAWCWQPRPLGYELWLGWLAGLPGRRLLGEIVTRWLLLEPGQTPHVVADGGAGGPP